MLTDWQLENILTGTYVDSTAVDHPGVVETDAFRYQFTDIAVEEPDDPLYRVARRIGGTARYVVETTVRFDEAPDPDELREHPYWAMVGGRVEQAADALTVEMTVPDRRRYEQRITYFKDVVEDVLG